MLGRPGRQLRSWFWKASVRDEVDAELEFHVAMRTRELVERGMDPASARTVALQRFGDIARVNRECRRIGERRDKLARRSDWVFALRQDLRFAVRQLARSPGFTLVAAFTLALGIGATTAVFSVIDGILLRPLPFPTSDRVVRIDDVVDVGNTPGGWFSRPNLYDLQEQSRAFSAVAAWRVPALVLTGVREAQALDARGSTANVFDVFGMRLALGKPFTRANEEPGNGQVVVIGHGLWTTTFGGDSSIIGRTIALDGESHTVVGVMPQGSGFPYEVEAWIPLARDPSMSRKSHHLRAVGLLAPGWSLAQARAELAVVARRLAEKHPDANGGHSFRATPYLDAVVGSVRPALRVLFAAVACLLLIACVNVANLLLARAASREREIGVRTALGAGRWRIVRQLLVESLALACLGGTLGLLLAYWGFGALIAAAGDALPRAEHVRIDARVLVFAFAVTTLTGAVFGLAPALRGARGDVAKVLGGGRGASADRTGARLRRALATAELALALVLLAAAGALVRSFARLRAVDAGFDARNVAALDLVLPDDKYGTQQSAIDFYRELLEHVAATPGVRAVAATHAAPISGREWGNSLRIEGREVREQQEPVLGYTVVSPGFFRVAGIPLRAGRDVEWRDGGDAPVVIINETAARRFFPNESPLGRRVRIGLDRTGPWITVVGVVGDVPKSLDVSAEPHMYVPLSQDQVSSLTVLARADSSPVAVLRSLQATVRAIDRDIPIQDPGLLEARVAGSISRQRFTATLLATFAVLALVLACVGVYGVLSYAVAQRRPELGIRLAIGARPGEVVSLVLRDGLRVAIAGIAIGLPVAVAGLHTLRGLVFGVSATDPMTLAVASLALAGVAIFAAYLPARRATRIDPVDVLRRST